MTTLSQLDDRELIDLYLTENSENAMRTLVGRHTDRQYSRFMREVRNDADAKDLEQQLWLQVVRNLPKYVDEGKFSHYLARIAGNLVKDFWRASGRKKNVFVESRAFENDDGEFDSYGDADNHASPSPDEEQKAIDEEMVDYLVNELIPALPVDQRSVWLLRHESEYWENDQRLEWSHLASLNGETADRVWEHFESAREKLMSSKKQDDAMDGIETLIFTVWTQAQRLRKSDSHTWEYFANLLGVSVNTLKTRYRAAQKTLSEGLNQRMQASL